MDFTKTNISKQSVYNAVLNLRINNISIDVVKIDSDGLNTTGFVASH